MAQETSSARATESKDPGTTGFDTTAMTDQERDEAASRLVVRFSLWSGAAGLIPIPIPGLGTVSLGIGAGPLLVALIAGKLRRTGPLLWVMPIPANIVLRNFGLALFLAAVGINAGQPFASSISGSDLTMLFVGMAVVLATVLIVLFAGHYVLRIPFDDLVGVASGATGNPAILVYSTRMAPTERPDIAYAMIFPSMTIVKVIAVQIVGLILSSGASP